MKKFLKHLFNPGIEDDANNTGHLYNLTIFWIGFLTLLLIIFLFIFLDCNLLSGVVTFLLVAAASFAGGAATGFLFGLPRAEKFRYIKKEDADHNSRDYSYGDNTNLEEVSDWLTKIIVGLTLIKLNVIIGWINSSAHSIEHVFNSGCHCDNVSLNAYVFGYCTIIFYFLAGAGLCYLWARTNLSLIFTDSKRKQREIERRKILTELQSAKNSNFQAGDGVSAFMKLGEITTFIKKGLLTDEQREVEYPTASFRNIVESIYHAKPTYDKSDLQRDRWGGKSMRGDFVFEAIPIDLNGHNVKLVVRSLNINNPVTGEIAFFLHDTFPSQIVYSVASQNKAEITFWAFEAFVAGARLEDGTELELDINKVKGFPESFYWKE
jgi:hypothetical protein